MTNKGSSEEVEFISFLQELLDESEQKALQKITKHSRPDDALKDILEGK